MPTYEYRCEHCGDFEHIQRITDPPLARCPECGRKVRRLISTTSFQLKGSGWYVTDYARGAGAAPKKEGGVDGGSGSGSGAGEGKTESKAESGGSDSKAAAAGTSEKSPS